MKARLLYLILLLAAVPVSAYAQVAGCNKAQRLSIDLYTPLPPPDPQQFEQLRRQHRLTILAALATLDAQQHALGINIADLERDNFRDAQPGAVGGGERRLVLRC